MRMRMLLVLFLLASVPALTAQEPDPPPPDSVAWSPPDTHPGSGAVDGVPTDTVSAPPVTIPEPTEPTLKGWFQAIINEYSLALLVFLSSWLTLGLVKKYPTIARFETAMKLLVMFVGAMAIYAGMRVVGGTVPENVAMILVDGLGPAIAAALAAAGVSNIGKLQKPIVTAARDEARFLAGLR